MHRLVQQIRRLVPGYDTSVPDIPLNRIAQGHSHDRALAAFKADQIRVARRARQTSSEEQDVRV
jgi:hypothetical protein